MYMVLCAISVIKLTDRLIADLRQCCCPSVLFLLRMPYCLVACRQASVYLPQSLRLCLTGLHALFRRHIFRYKAVLRAYFGNSLDDGKK